MSIHLIVISFIFVMVLLAPFYLAWKIRRVRKAKLKLQALGARVTALLSNDRLAFRPAGHLAFAFIFADHGKLTKQLMIAELKMLLGKKLGNSEKAEKELHQIPLEIRREFLTVFEEIIKFDHCINPITGKMLRLIRFLRVKIHGSTVKNNRKCTEKIVEPALVITVDQISSVDSVVRDQFIAKPLFEKYGDKLLFA